jgi:hypothetical protein
MPDAGIMVSLDARSSVSSPTCVVEVVFTHPKDLETAHAHCLEYFECAPSVRAAVLIRFGTRDPVDRKQSGYFIAVGAMLGPMSQMLSVSALPQSQSKPLRGNF